MTNIIAITGGIGSGKSLAAGYLKDAGYTVYSADGITSALYKKHSVKKQIKKMFPAAVSGKIALKVDKKKIAEEVFSNKIKLAELNAFFHNKVIEEILLKAKKSKEKVVFAEVPLLFESNSQSRFNGVIVLMRERTARIKDVIKRSFLTEKEIAARMENQVNYDSLDLSSYIVINNDGDKEKLKEAVLSAAKKCNYSR